MASCSNSSVPRSTARSQQARNASSVALWLYTVETCVLAILHASRTHTPVAIASKKAGIHPSSRCLPPW